MTIYSIDNHFDENELPGLYEFEDPDIDSDKAGDYHSEQYYPEE